MGMPNRQLHLFKSRQQRGCAPPSPSEYQLHSAVADTVTRWILPDYREVIETLKGWNGLRSGIHVQ